MDKVNPDPNALLPVWFLDDLFIPFQARIASEFIIHGDINGLVQNPDAPDDSEEPYITARRFWEKIFDEKEIVIFYNIASGLRFLTQGMEKKFKKIAGLESDEEEKKDPVAAAKSDLRQKRGIPREPESCLPLIEKVMKTVGNTAVLINSAHFIAPTAGGGIALPQTERINIERLKNWAQDEEIRQKNNIILLLTEQAAKVSSELRQSGSEIATVFMPKPSREERLKFIRSITEGNEECKNNLEKLKGLRAKLEKCSIASEGPSVEAEIKNCEELLMYFPNLFLVPDDFQADAFALATQGMSLRQILEVFLHSKKTGRKISLDYVREKKKEILNNEYGEIMEIVEPEKGLEDIGGLEHIKSYLNNVLEAIKQGEARLVPMGVTLMGPPGTGKTAIVEALAKEAKFNFVKTKNVRSMWVGESETRMEKLIYGLRSLAPVVVMNDEADLAEAGRDSPRGDSGVSERLMKCWMELLSDPKIRGQIIVISCTNRPDRIDPALKRSGRSDERILLPMPSREERAAIFRVMFKRHNIPSLIKDFAEFAEMTDCLSGADIEKVSLNAYRFAFERGEPKVSEKILRETIEDFIPSASQKEIDRMTLLAILESSSRRLLPPRLKEIVEGIKARDLVENLNDILAQIKERNIVEID